MKVRLTRRVQNAKGDFPPGATVDWPEPTVLPLLDGGAAEPDDGSPAEADVGDPPPAGDWIAPATTEGRTRTRKTKESAE